MGRLATDTAGKTPVSLGLLGAAAFMVVADARVIDPLLHIIADEFKVGVGSAAIIISAYTIPYGLFQLVYGPLSRSHRQTEGNYNSTGGICCGYYCLCLCVKYCLTYLAAVSHRDGCCWGHPRYPSLYW
ncbi:hypothetical protein [Nostoc sp.]|uniref:hypothetical protein n=1 Tax=Nostoc sp. TaxID=1180 RepID=UPI002FF4DCC7